MNPDETKSLITKLLLMIFTTLSTSLHMSESAGTLATASSDIADLAVLGYSIYSHWNMRKVSEDARVVGGVMLLLAALLYAPPSRAADMVKASLLPHSYAAPDCTQTDCSGWVVGANIIGVGSNLDILGSGVQGSLFAGGGMVGLEAGYQLWNGKFFAGALASIDYDVGGSGAPNQGKWLGMQLVQLGIGLSGIFAPSTGQPPLTIPAQIASALLSPYLQFGAAERARGDAWVMGAGAAFTLSPLAGPGKGGWLLTLDYLNLDYSHGQSGAIPGAIVQSTPTEHIVKTALKRTF